MITPSGADWIRRLLVAALAIVLAMAVALGMWMRFSIISEGSLWLDELWSLDAVSRSFKEMIGARLVSDTNPPLWSMVAWVWLRLAGSYDPVAVRLLPLALNAMAITAPVLGAIRMPSLRVPMMVMAGLSATSLFFTQYAVEFRSYSMLLAFGSSATVIWAGLLSGDLPRQPRWLFSFALTGALAGFAHYYGYLLYAGEGLVLLAALVISRERRATLWLLVWGTLSLAPVSLWLWLTSRWRPSFAVAGPPDWHEVQTWFAQALGPLSNLSANHPPGYAYPDSLVSFETLIPLVAALILLGLCGWALVRRDSLLTSPAVWVGASALVVAVAGTASAWLGSLVLPPNMNARNLGALLPAVFLAIGCAAAPTRWATISRLSGLVVVSTLALGSFVFLQRFGAASMAPPWQLQAGYSAVSQELIASRSVSSPPVLIGLEWPWHWHGDWEASLRSELGQRPAESTDPPPLSIQWIWQPDGELPSAAPPTPLLLFTASQDDRWAELTEWASRGRPACTATSYGGQVGLTVLLRCPAQTTE